MPYVKSHPRLLAALAAAVVGGIALWLLLSPAPADQTWVRIQETGTLRVGTDASYPPFENLDGADQIIGFDVDLANEMGRRLHLRVELTNIAYDGLVDALIGQKVDVLVSALADLPQAAGKVAFTLPYYNAGDTLVVRVGSNIRSMGDMSGRKLAVEFGSGGDVAARAWERRIAKLTVKRYMDSDAAVAALMSNEADGALVDGIAARLAVGQNPELALVTHVNDVLFAIAAPTASVELRHQLDKVIQDMLKDGTISRLIARWFGPQRDVATP